MSAQSPQRGALPTPQGVIAAAVRHVARVAAPATYIVVPQTLSFWGNYYNGDCVTAEEAFAKACNNPEIFISENEVVAWATQNGYLNGAYLTPVMTTMQSDGFVMNDFIYDDGPYLYVDYTNAAVLQSAISNGPVKLGVAGGQLDTVWLAAGGTAADGVSGWFATGFQADAVEDHCVSLCGYGSISWLAKQLGVEVPADVNGANSGYAMFTWDSIGIIDEASMLAITHEAWLRQPTTVKRLAGPPLAGFPVANDAARVYFLDQSNHVNELAWENDGWVNTGDLTAKTGASAGTARSALMGFPVADYAARVYFLDQNSHVNELAWENNGWVNTGDLTAKTGASPAWPATALMGFPVANDAARVYFLDQNNHVNELAWDYTVPNGWGNTGDLTAKTGASPAMPGSALMGFPVADYAARVYFLDQNNHVNELAWENNGWINTGDLTNLTHAVPA